MKPALRVSLLLALALSVAAAACAQTVPGALTLRASAGLADSKLDGWNEPLSDYARYGQLNYDPLGPSLRPQLEIVWMPIRGVTLGAAGSYQKLKSSERYASGGFSIDDALSITLWRTTGRLAWWPSRLPGAYLGGEVGTASAKAEETFRGSLLPFTPVSDSWSGSGTIYGLFVGMERRVGRHGLLGFVEAGWDFQSLGQLGDSRYDPDLVYPVVLTPVGTGRAIDSDFSGMHLSLGLGWSVGGKR